MLISCYSNRVETLADYLAEVVRRPLREPLAQETIIVQSNGMARWLSMQLATRLGICANIEYPFPAAFLWQALRSVLGDVPEQSPYDKPVLIWRVLALLGELEQASPFEPLHNYLRGGTLSVEPEQSDLRAYQLAWRIADIYDQYLVYRPNWLALWENGQYAHWQAELWRRLRLPGEEHQARLQKRFAEALKTTESRAEGLPERVSLMGISSLPPTQLELLALLAEHLDVHLLLLNPCREYWGDIVAERDLARLTEIPHKNDDKDDPDRDDPGESDPAEQYLEVGNPLLASLGKQGRDFIDLLQGYGAEVLESYTEAADGTLLDSLQNDILNLHQRGGLETQTPAFEKGGLGRGSDEKGISGELRCLPSTAVSADDRSVQVHACHSPLREIEVLHDQLLALFESYPDLRPADVVVMMPDIEVYSPTIEAVFATVERDRFIPYSIADRGIGAERPLVDALLELLALPRSRFDANRVLALLEYPAIRRRFDLSEADFGLIEHWLRATGVRWGVDQSSRAELDLPALREHSWRAGLERLLLGYALPGNNLQQWGEVLPYDDVEGSQGQVLGRLQAFAEALFRLREEVAAAQAVAAWVDCLLASLDTFFLPLDDEEDQLDLIRDALATLLSGTEQAKLQRPLELDLIRTALRQVLESSSRPGGFFSGGVTFCTMVPMRSVPFQVVCLIGINHDSYPRPHRLVDFDLMAKRYRKGDRARRLDDRYLFLEALLSARRCFYLSYVGNDIRDNSVIPPSVLVSELLDVIERGFFLPGAELRERLLVRHPLQAFSQRYFDLDGSDHDQRLFSYSAELEDAGRRAALARCGVPPFVVEDLPQPETEWRLLEVPRLLEFFDQPVRFLLRHRLGLQLDPAEGLLETAEPFVPDGLERYQLRQRLLDYRLRQVDAERALTLCRNAGLLPHGQVGEVVLAREWELVSWFAGRLRRFVPEDWLEPLEVDLLLGEFRIVGWLEPICEQGLIGYRPATVKARDLLRLWLRHLLLNLIAPSAIERHSTWVALDGSMNLLPVTEPERYLQTLLDYYWQGLRRPLPLFPASAYRYVQTLRADSRRKPDNEARKTWQGSDYYPGESNDPYYRQVFADADPIGQDFFSLAESVWHPLLEHLEVPEERVPAH